MFYQINTKWYANEPSFRLCNELFRQYFSVNYTDVQDVFDKYLFWQRVLQTLMESVGDKLVTLYTRLVFDFSNNTNVARC